MKEIFQKTIALLLCSCLTMPLPLSAAEQRGKIIFGTSPVPGATVTATQGDKKITVLSDADGSFYFADLPDGMWTLEVDMLGFSPIKKDITTAAGAAPVNLEMMMMPFEDIHAEKAAPVVTGVQGAGPAGNDAKPDAKQQTAVKQSSQATRNNGKNAPAQQSGFQRADVNATGNAPAPEPSAAPEANSSPAELSQRAADGYLINGSSVNGASSAFALNPAIGNNRRGLRSLYNGSIGFTLGDSAWNARQYSLTGQDTAKPQTTQFTGLGSFGGPIRIPHLVRNGGNFTVNYQWTRNSSGSTQPALVPTQAEQGGDFSQTLTRAGQPVELNNVPGVAGVTNKIPLTDISPQAMALLSLYPLPNFTGSNIYNYQVALVSHQHTDGMQARWGRQAGRKNNLNFNFGFQDNRTSNPSIFNFLDSTRSLGYQGTFTWRRTYTNRFYGNFSVQFSRYSVDSLSNFENRQNVSQQALITGNDQAPLYYGPPNLSFAGSGFLGLGDGVPATSHNQTINPAYSSTWNHGRHNVSFGADYKWQQFNNLSESNPRGTFTFAANGVTGYDFADFLLGTPDAVALSYSPLGADRYLRERAATAYIGDDWRTSPSLTINGAIYWQYGSPLTEKYNRLVNLDVGPFFSSIAPVTATNPTGVSSGMGYPSALINSEKGEFMPRLGLSWRPISGSSMVVRASYGMYYDTFSAYQFFATGSGQYPGLAKQPPFSKSFTLNTLGSNLNLGNAFVAALGGTTNSNTFGVDPNFRSGYAQIWQASIQRDLPASLQMTVTYQGIKGTRAPQAFLPNTYAPGGINPCPSCPTGFIYITSNGNSTREAGTFMLRRRLHNGFQAQIQYTYAKAIDDTAGLGSASSAFNSPAQNWLDLSGERGPSTFDQRHNAQIQFQYTSGTGVRGGTLLGGWRGALVKEWTLVSNVNFGSGLPFTPIYPSIVPGSSVSQIRADFLGGDPYAGTGLSHLNASAFAAPAAGQWGNAGRDSLYGPMQFNINASLGRTFRMSDRYSLDVRIDSTNPINHVVPSGWYNTVGNSQFGAVSSVAGMRNATGRVVLRF